jgi:hypothetical protein
MRSIGGNRLLVSNMTNTPTHSLKDSNASLKVKTMEEKEVGVHSLARSISRVEGRVGAPEWGLRRMTSESIIYTDMHKPNNKLVCV